MNDKKGLTRREFTKGVAAFGALAATGVAAKEDKSKDLPDLVVAQGPRAADNITQALAALGGIQRFVKPGQTVGFFLNYLSTTAAGRTKPEVIRTVVSLCKKARAKKIMVLDWAGEARWKDTGLKTLIDELGVEYVFTDANDKAGWVTKKIPKGKKLHEVRLLKSMWTPDVLLTLPVFKHHRGAQFSGACKIYMAASHRQDNRQKFHAGPSAHLQQCIADLNTVVRPADLIVMEAMEVLMENGPFGPGATTKPHKVILGTDRVAIDAYCAPIQRVDPTQSVQIQASHRHGIGQADLSKLKIGKV